MTLTTTNAAKIEAKIQQFTECMNDAADSIRHAAKLYYEALQIDPKARDLFRERMPSVSSVTWAGLIRVATGELHPALLFDASPGARALTYCPAEEQQQYVEHAIPVAVGNGDSMLIHIDKMTSEQARQVFNKGAIRDLAEQRAWIETQKTREAIKRRPKVDAANQIYVKGDKLHVGDVQLTRAELIKYLGQMEK